MVAEVAEAVEALFTHAHEREHFSGACLVSAAGETVFTGAFGMAHKGFNVPNTMSTRFDTASITKLFTAVAVLQLVDTGQVHMEDSVVDLLGLQGTAISNKVTIYHLLTHTSGIGDDGDEEAGESYEEIWKSKPNYSVRETIDFPPQLIHKPPNFEPVVLGFETA